MKGDDRMGGKGYVNPQLLITPEALRARLEDPSVCIVDTRPTHEYAAGHIPGAVHADLYISLNDTREAPFRAFMATLAYVLENRGVDTDKTIVFYENEAGMRAARGFWICEYFGGRDVHVLDGGLRAWKETGGPVTTACPPPPKGKFQGTPVPERHIGADEIRGVLGRADCAVLDTRTDDEYYGRVARAARAGAIPGAIHIEWTHNLDAKGAFKPADALRAMYEKAGITPDRQVVCYCQGGYRSAHAYLALRLLGYPTVRNYIGSWREWGDRADLPIETPKK
jgi:thiosulfate/3-mercaptopyruvate sulfurtransferase